jgi:hypothetical protein
MATDTSESNQLPINTIQVFKPDMSKLLDLTNFMINKGEIKTDIEFAKKFMFSFDSPEKFPINLELLLEMKVYELKHKAKEALIKTFTEQVDFKIEKATHPNGLVGKKKGGSGSLKENIFLTTECFKNTCMLVKNEMGRKTQQYYLDLEKVFKTYVIFEFQQSQLQLQEATKTIKHIESSRQQLLLRQRRTVYEIGNAIYVISNKAFSVYYKDDYFKFGKVTQKVRGVPLTNPISTST